MNHFTTEEWIDFVNAVTPIEQRGAMQEHLQSGCTRCNDELLLWGKVRTTAERQRSFQPAPEVVQSVKNALRTVGAGKPRKEATLVEVLFDSFLQPAIAGARSMTQGSRQMLYRAGPYQIDIEIENKAGSNTLAIAGQIMDVSTPEFVTKNIPVTLSSLRGHIVYTVTNEFGEFRAEIENSGDLELSISRYGDSPLTISLRNALGQIPGDAV
jgi:hypothetical protein